MENEWGVEPEYVKLVEESAKNSDGSVIQNPSLKHARVLIYNLIKHAKKTIRIYSGKLDARIFDDSRIMREITEKLNDGVKMSIVLDRKEETEIKGVTPTKLDRNSTKDVARYLNEIQGHFIIVDSKMYRFEAKHSEDINNVKGVVSFNSPEKAISMEKIFDRVLVQCSN